MIGLTRKQRELYDFIAARLRVDGVAPSYAEMAAAMGCHVSNIHRMIGCIEDRGYIRRLPHCARAIEIIPQEPAGDAVRLHPEVRAAATDYAQRHGITLSTALAEAARGYFLGDKAA